MDLEVKKISMTEHAYRRAKERFDIPDKKHALSHFQGLLRLAKRVGQVTAEDGRESILYAHGRTAIHLSLDLSTIITVIRHEEVSYVPLKSKIETIHRIEFNKLNRIEKSKKRKIEDMKLKYAIELAQIEYRYKKTRSNNVRMYCVKRKSEILNEISQQEKEIVEISNAKRAVAKSMVAVL